MVLRTKDVLASGSRGMPGGNRGQIMKMDPRAGTLMERFWEGVGAPCTGSLERNRLQGWVGVP